MSERNPFSDVQFGNFQGLNLDVSESSLSLEQLAAQKAQTQLLLNMKNAANAPMGDAMALSDEALKQIAQHRGLQGATQEAHRGFLGNLWHRFESASSLVYMPGMIGMLSLVGLGGMTKADPSVSRISKASWFGKPFHWIVDKCHWFNEKMIPWGTKISSFVLDKCRVGKLLGQGQGGAAHTGLWKMLKKVAEYGPGWKTLQEGRWYSGIATFFKGAGAFSGTGTAATSIAKTGLRFSLRSVLTGFGFAGPVGWLAGGIAAAWTAVSLIKGVAKWFSSSGNQPSSEGQPQQQFVSPATALGSYGTGYGGGPQFSAFGPQPPLA